MMIAGPPPVHDRSNNRNKISNRHRIRRQCIRQGQRKAAGGSLPAKGTVITTYETTTLQPNFGLRRAFPWEFIVANVTQPIFYHLLPDMQQKKLIDGKTELSATGSDLESKTQPVKTIVEQTYWLNFQGSFNYLGRQRSQAHQTTHYIKTIPKAPEACRPRRLAPDRYMAAKNEFNLLLEEDIIQPSKMIITATHGSERERRLIMPRL